MIDLKKNVAKNKRPKYYAVFIILSLLPQILGINSVILGTLWKVVVLLFLLFLVSNKVNDNKISLTGLYYLIFYLLINSICLLADFKVTIATILNIGISVLLVYLFFDCPIKEKKLSNSDILGFFRIFACFMVVSCIFNMIVNIRQLFNIASISIYGSDATKSFFDNKNTFGVFLIFGTISATFLKVVGGNNKWLFAMMIFLLNEVMAMCRTAIVLTLFFIIVSFLVGDSKTLKSRIIALFVVLVTVISLYFSNSTIRNFIDNNLFGNTDSLDTRDGYIEKMLPLAKGIRLFFGYGEERSIELAGQYAGNRYYHNTYLHLLMNGGLLKIILFAVGVLYSLKNTIKLCKINKKKGRMCLATIIAYLIYASIESVILFDTPVVAMVATIFVISIPQWFLNAEN